MRGTSGRGCFSSGKIDLAKELAWLQNGYYTEPADQSVWYYHNNILFDKGRLNVDLVKRVGGVLFVMLSK